MTNISYERLPLTIQGTALDIAAISRNGTREPILFLHGFGSTKEDYADIARHSAFDGHAFLAYDAPGCGESRCSDLSKLSMPFLIETALAVLDVAGYDRFHLIGHSMGGLTAALVAHAVPDRVLSFVNIKGNLAAEDCFLSRQIFQYAASDDERFLDDFIARTRLAPAYSSALFAASLRHKVRPGSVRPIFESMVAFSDTAGLLEKFIALPCPRMFMYGVEYAGLSYLPALDQGGVILCEIPECGHFPMYSNPPAMWDAIAAFHKDRCRSGSL
ncbi:alpha/beta hydrolase (plasmid) [Bosea sp. F3-2]|uniref:alpha/beta fold hydrolase n=1 Tax=Bosea sp. F3-2 TaxID=2599640 RepID=UPI0011EDA513|nr:alpha/beta hydrolase [Bosea sp. F3-2]QEL27347.1 alpha/beta hydrolase [Bosea sp. F3-2]